MQDTSIAFKEGIIEGKKRERIRLLKRLLYKFSADDEDWIRESIKEVMK